MKNELRLADYEDFYDGPVAYLRGGNVADLAVPLIRAGRVARVKRDIGRTVEPFLRNVRKTGAVGFLGLAGLVGSPDKGCADENRMYVAGDNFEKDDEKILLARALFGEARNCSPEEMVCVAYTIINRANDGVKWNGESVREVILKPRQYSCFDKNDPNRQKLKDPIKYDAGAFKVCLEVAEAVLNGKINDPTGGATHYHTSKVRPDWAGKNNMHLIGNIYWTENGKKRKTEHIFYREKVERKKAA